MKKSDIAAIILIVSISLVVGYFVGKAVIGTPDIAARQAEVVEPITSDIVSPNKKIFNQDAINPAVPISIGNSSNQQPFTGSDN